MMNGYCWIYFTGTSSEGVEVKQETKPDVGAEVKQEEKSDEEMEDDDEYVSFYILLILTE